MSTPTAQIFFDDSGNTGNDLSNASQRNMLIGGILVLPETAAQFWSDIDAIIKRAETLSGTSGVELKGTEIYRGIGSYATVSEVDRFQLIQDVRDAILRSAVYVVYQGFPKHMLQARLQANPQSLNVWQGTLFAFCRLLHDVLGSRLVDYQFEVAGDENNLCPPGHALTNTAWSRFVNHQVRFKSSSATPGLQVADLLIHTLYRANKTNLLPTGAAPPLLATGDQFAEQVRLSLEAQKRILLIADPAE